MKRSVAVVTIAAWLVSCFLSLPWAGAQEPDKKGEAAKADEAKIQGTWIGHVAREPAAGPPEMITMIVRGAQCEFKSSRPGVEYKGTLALNPAANPRQVDFLIKESGDTDQRHVGKTSLGIYKIDEDGPLPLAANEPGVATRPEKFEPAPPQGTVVFVFKKWAPGMALPGNPPELKVLEKRIGTWATETIVKPGQWAPKGHKATGIETTEWILGGRFQQSRGANRPADPDGMFVCTYDTQIKAFRGWYLDDQGNKSEFTGQWDEAAQTLNWTSGDKDGVRTTSSTRFVGPDNIEWQLTTKDPEGKVMLEVAGKLVRKK